MAGVFSRTLMSSPCMLMQLPAPVRQSSALHASFLLARQAAPSPPSASRRLFHASPIAAIRKPRSPVLKSTAKQSSQPPSHPSSPPKKPVFPFHAQNIPYETHGAFKKETQSHREANSPSPQESVPPTTKHLRPNNALPFQRAKTPHDLIVENLALSKNPTILFTAASQTSFILVCVVSTVFLTWVSLITWKNYQIGIDHGRNELIGVAIINTLVWVSLATYLALGPVGLIKRVVAVPAKLSGPLPAVYTPKPTLRFEPVTLPLVKWPKPIELELSEVHSDRLFSHEMEAIAMRNNKASPPGVVDEYFGWVLSIWTAYLKMFARVQRFAQVRAGRVNLKLDMRGCQTLDNGRVLDELIKVDTTRFNTWKRMFMKN